jgi:hypothetical protein
VSSDILRNAWNNAGTTNGALHSRSTSLNARSARTLLALSAFNSASNRKSSVKTARQLTSSSATSGARTVAVPRDAVPVRTGGALGPYTESLEVVQDDLFAGLYRRQLATRIPQLPCQSVHIAVFPTWRVGVAVARRGRARVGGGRSGEGQCGVTRRGRLDAQTRTRGTGGGGGDGVDLARFSKCPRGCRVWFWEPWCCGVCQRCGTVSRGFGKRFRSIPGGEGLALSVCSGGGGRVGWLALGAGRSEWRRGRRFWRVQFLACHA